MPGNCGLRWGRISEGRDPGPLPRGTSPGALAEPITAIGTSVRPPTIVCVSHVSPWPVRAGNEYRLSRLLDHLKRAGYRLVLVVTPLPGDPLAPGAVEHLAGEFGNVIVCDRRGRIDFRLRDCPDVVTRLSGTPPPPFESQGAGRSGDAGLARTDAAYCPDVVVAVVTALVERWDGPLPRVTIIRTYTFGSSARRIVWPPKPMVVF